ncbi:MAG: hypothetical protein QOI78_1246 [Actinomycetota bacterium]|nr:hypothetical protein [Actinomycetota bacterium]
MSGPDGGEPVLLLHGFPLNATMWDVVSAGQHAARLRTIAPDQRGYAFSAALDEDLAQKLRSAYVTLFRLTGGAETALLALDATVLRSLFGPGACSGAQWLTPDSSTNRYGPVTCAAHRSATYLSVSAPERQEPATNNALRGVRG